MATYGPAPWQRGLRRSDALIRKVSAGDAARVYDQEIADPMPIGTPRPEPIDVPAQGPIPNRPGNWMWNLGARAVNNRLATMTEPPRQYPGSWGTPEAYQRSQSGLLTPEERYKYGQGGIDEQNEWEQSKRDTTIIPPKPAPERNPLNPYAPNGVGNGLLGADVDAPSSVMPPKEDLGLASLSAQDARESLPLTSGLSWERKQDFVLSNYPNLFAAAKQAGLSNEEVFDVVNLTLAVDASRTIAATVNPQRQQQLLMAMPPPQRALVLDLLTATIAESQRKDGAVTTGAEVAQVNANPALTARNNAGDEQNPVLRFFSDKVWNPSVGLDGLPFVYPDTNWGPIQGGELYFGGKGVFDSFLSANEMAIRGAGALSMTPAMGWTSAWNATEAGSFDPEMLAVIKQNNDPLTVDIMVTIKKLGAMGDDDPIGALIEKYGNNPQAMAIVDQILLNTDPNSDLSKLANEIDTAETSNLMNVASWSLVHMGGAGNAGNYADIEAMADSNVYKGGAKLGNVALTFLLDPTIAVAGASTIYKAGKYGVTERGLVLASEKAGLRGLETWAALRGNDAVIPALRQARLGLGTFQPGRIDAVFQTKGVRNYFNYLGGELERVRGMENVGDQAQVFNSLASQNKRWFTGDALKVMLDAGVKDAATAKTFFDDAENVQLLLSGQAGKRTKQFVVPHMTVGYAKTKHLILVTRGWTVGRLGSKTYLDAIFGQGTSQMMPQEAADYISKVIEDDPQQIGRALSDFRYVDEGGGVRTLTGRLVDRVDGTDRSLPAEAGADPNTWRRRDRYGWMRVGGIDQALGAVDVRKPWLNAPEAWGYARKSLDRLGRLFAHMPDASRGIPVVGNEGAEMVKELAQGLGMSRYFANYLKFLWPSLTQPQRVRLVNGLNRTGLITSGVDLVNPALADALVNTYAAVATRTATQYAPSYIDMIRIRASAERAVEKMDRARKAQNKAALTAIEREEAVLEEAARLAEEEMARVVPPEAAAPAAADEAIEEVQLPEREMEWSGSDRKGWRSADGYEVRKEDEHFRVFPPEGDPFGWFYASSDAKRAAMRLRERAASEPATPAASADEVVDELVDEAPLTEEEFTERLSEVMPYADDADVDDSIEQAIVSQEEGDLDQAEYWLRKAYDEAGLEWPAREAAAAEAPPAPAPAAWDANAVPLPEERELDELIDLEPGVTVGATNVEGARPDLWIKVTEEKDTYVYTIWGKRSGGDEGIIVRWDADVRDGETPVQLFDGATADDQRAAWDFMQRVYRTYRLLDIPDYRQVVDDSAEKLARVESLPTATPIARVSVGEVPEGTATWKRAGGEHTERTTMPRGEMAIVRYEIPGREPYYTAHQPHDGVRDSMVEISWYASDGALHSTASAGVDKNIVEAMKGAITKWGKENGVKTPTKWTRSNKPRPVDPAEVIPATAPVKPPSREGNEAARTVIFDYQGESIPIRTTVDAAGERTNFGGYFVGDPSLVWRRDTGELVTGPHYTDADLAEELYVKALAAAEEFDLGTLPSFAQMRETYGDDFGVALERRIAADAPDTLTVAGLPVIPKPTGRTPAPISELLSGPGKGKQGYTSTIKIGKNHRTITVTTDIGMRGERKWSFHLSERPDVEYDLAPETSFNEYGNVTGTAFGLRDRRFPDRESSYTAANGYNKQQYQALAKAIVQEAARHDIPIRGQLADWLEDMGVKGVQRDPEVWDARAVEYGMDEPEIEAAVDFMLARNPSLADKVEYRGSTYDGPVGRRGEDRPNTVPGYEGKMVKGRSAYISTDHPEVRRLLAEYLGRVDDGADDVVEPMRVTHPYDGTDYDRRFRPSGRPLGGSTDGLGTAMPDMVAHSAPDMPRVPGVEETIDGLTFRLRVTMRRGQDGEVEYTGIAADVAREGAFEKRGWGGIDASIDWHRDGKININSPRTESFTGTTAATARQAEEIRLLEQWVTDVAETHGLDIDLPWAGYYPRRGDWGYTGDPVDEVADEVRLTGNDGGTESHDGAFLNDGPYTYDWNVITPDNVTDGGDEAYGNAVRISVSTDDGKFSMAAAWAEDGMPIDVWPMKGFRQGVKPSAEEKRASEVLHERLHYAAMDLSHKRPGFKYEPEYGSPGYPAMSANVLVRGFPIEVTERADIVGPSGKEFLVTIAAGVGFDGGPAWAVRVTPKGESRFSDVMSDTIQIGSGGSIPEGGAYKLRYPPDGEKSGFYDQGSYKKATWEAIAAALVRDGDELGIPIREGTLGFWLSDMGYGDQLRTTFAPVATPPAPPAPAIDDIVEWAPNVTLPEDLAKQVPSGAPGKKTRNPIVAVLKNVDDTLPGLMQAIPAERGGLWVTDRYRLLRLSDADAAGIQPGMKLVAVRTKARIEQDMKVAAMVSTTDARYRELEAELQAALDGKALAAVGPNDGQAPKIDSFLAGMDDVVANGTVFVPNRLIASEKRYRGDTTAEMVTDGVAHYQARYYRDLPKGSVIKYVQPDKPAAVVDESGELIGLIMPITMKGVPETPAAGRIKHPVHGDQEGWRYTDGDGNTYHLYHRVTKDTASYINPADKPKTDANGMVDRGWWLELRTKGLGPDSPSQALAIHWKPDGTLDSEGGTFISWGRQQPDDVKARLSALADRLIQEKGLPLQRLSELDATPAPAAAAPAASAAAPAAAAVPGPTKQFKIDKRVYQEFREELGLGDATRETKTLAYIELDHNQFTALVERAHQASKTAPETMAPGPAVAAQRKYRDAMQSLWDQGAPEAGAAADEVAAEVATEAPVQQLTLAGYKGNPPKAGSDVKRAATRARKYPTATVAVYTEKGEELADGVVVQVEYPKNGFGRPMDFHRLVRSSHLVPVDPEDVSKGFIYRPIPEEVALDRLAEAIFYYPGGAFDPAVIDALLEEGVTRAQIRAANNALFDKDDVYRYQGSYTDFPAVVGDIPEGMERVVQRIANGDLPKGSKEPADTALSHAYYGGPSGWDDFNARMTRIVERDPSLLEENGGPVSISTYDGGLDYRVDPLDERLIAAWDEQADEVVEAATPTPEPVETEVVPPANPIPEATPAEPEVIEGTVIRGGEPPQEPPATPRAAAGEPDGVPGLSKREKRAIRRGEVAEQRRLALDNGDIKNPSSLNGTDNYALYDSQLTQRVSIIDPAKMNMLMARSSYLNALLGGGPKMTELTDWWTLATLAGPRFVMRSGIEDFGLYALTGGQFFGHGGWLDGRRASAAIREATERVEPTTNPLMRGNNPGMKLSLATTTRRELGTLLARRIPAFRALLLPYLDEAEVAAATAQASARGSARSREALANLMATGFARARFFSINRWRWAQGGRIQMTGEAKYVADVIKDGVERGYLNNNMDRASEVAEHLADGTMPAYKAGPQGTEVIDGTTITYTKVGVDMEATRSQVAGFSTSWTDGGRNADDIEAFHSELDRALHQSGYKSYAAIARSRRYYRLKYEIERAVKPETKAKHQQALDEFLDEFAADIANDPRLGEYVLVEQLGVRGYGQRLLDDALRMMTTSDGYYNNQLLDALLLPNYRTVTLSNDLAEELGYMGSAKKDITTITINREEWNRAVDLATDPADRAALLDVGEPEVIYTRAGSVSDRRYGLYYFDEDGQFRYNIDAEDLHNPDIPMPQSIGRADVINVATSDKIPWSSRAWAAMGRSLARMTREPIYISNYVDSMRLIEPFKARMAAQLHAAGKPAEEAADMAGDWAAKLAADRAYQLTMAYVDNPAIRSQLAWQVRNVARFYRALEDFYRRALRLAQNDPVAYWKLALGFNVLDDSGFVWEDEFGDRYFIFPGTQVMFSVVNDFLSKAGVQPKVPGLPMAWGAKVTMLSPSTDPNAMVPTLGSPYSGVTIKGLLRFLPSVNVMSAETSQTIEGALFGEYSPNQTFTSSILNDVAGPNIARILDAVEATRGGEASRAQESDTMYASVAKQAIHAMAAAGLIDPSKDYTNEEMAVLRAQADATAMNILYAKAVLTPNLPATPQPVSLTVSDEARALGIDSGNALWLEYVNKYPSFEEAFVAFTGDNPGKAIFTVSKYENTSYYYQLTETEDFIKANRDEFNVRPIGLSHFAPMEGTYSGMNGFYFMRANGIKVPVTVESFFDSHMRASAEAEISYIDMVERQESQGVSAEQRKLVGDVADSLRADVRSEYPTADFGESIDRDSARQSARDADEIAETARYIIRTGQDTDGRAAMYLEAYDVYLSIKEAKAETEKGSPDRSLMNATWRSWVETDGMRMFRGDRRGLRFLRIMSTSLDTPVEGL